MSVWVTVVRQYDEAFNLSSIFSLRMIFKTYERSSRSWKESLQLGAKYV